MKRKVDYVAARGFAEQRMRRDVVHLRAAELNLAAERERLMRIASVAPLMVGDKGPFTSCVARIIALAKEVGELAYGIELTVAFIKFTETETEEGA